MNGQQGGSAANTAEHMLGIVLAVGRAAGTLTLGHTGGRCSQLTADPHLLRDVRTGGPVHALVEGTTVRTLRCL